MARLCKSILPLLLCLVAVIGVAHAAKKKAPPLEVAQLPRFCWAQYMPNVSGPPYEIPRKTCGVFMNHYCPALIEVIRANESFDNLGARKQHLTVARRETLYTLNGMKGFPNCPIRSHAESTLRQVEESLRSLDRYK